ncbi:MAG: DUF5331 domain-containing protein [Cyanobacteria bacterium]|nr:DUF5331 domain-containing protein [Cyanobacteria bacterium CG_2015-16_32_12]NCO77730.1 DUF5331 domain-containing protein [Cyanobacteria bacterium CG_2015-22_32_23]NCQ03033.1 DUF5331 domain-containing protein [Cyanobacteria bacterium CG_2015-09_32_10]NCQ40872.1 DUF5331 domain-containing protein [Cyanobacteria bacterium CG_2015-04_32_10]NCS83592.1 DUF5331 domain-containing protein [Cyanobacteria bacterium CG_2015-02_32_10]
MENFEEIKARLKKKWLHYYKHNRQWINKYCQENYFVSVQGSFEGETWETGERSLDDKRFSEVHPPSELIIGVITALEPFLAQYWLGAFMDLYANKEKIIVALGLNFDSELELKKIEQKKWENQQLVLESEVILDVKNFPENHYLSTTDDK